MKKSIFILLLPALLSGCGVAGRLASVGKAPKLTPADAVVSPETEQSLAIRGGPHTNFAGGTAEPQPAQQSASLFRVGAGSFFRDQRASRVGDILTIKINMQDRASVDNTTSRTREGGESGGIAGLLGLQNPLAKVLPGPVDPAKLVDVNSKSTNTGAGNTTRSETINMTMAATVTQVLPNGNLVIRGRQEVRVNFELRELVVSGMIRPEDIARDNSIQHTQIAEARVSYGGRGQLTDAQQARWGQQIYDALFPF
ncbi:MAG: flagellar L-ring protein FlgH [Alphaproteobacteria bacterium]|nr:flagellar L-ring protein FlgH [Alphaproteobacteria bacterium]